MKLDWKICTAALMLVCRMAMAQDSIVDASILVDSDGYVYDQPVSLVLLTEGATNYTVTCQIVYWDNRLRRPSIEDRQEVRKTAELLNGWLNLYLSEQCENADLAHLVESCVAPDFQQDLLKSFSRFVKTKTDEMSEDCRVDVKVEDLTIRAEGALRTEILRFMNNRDGLRQE